jgi:hypothetical protein
MLPLVQQKNVTLHRTESDRDRSSFTSSIINYSKANTVSSPRPRPRPLQYELECTALETRDFGLEITRLLQCETIPPPYDNLHLNHSPKGTISQTLVSLPPLALSLRPSFTQHSALSSLDLTQSSPQSSWYP